MDGTIYSVLRGLCCFLLSSFPLHKNTPFTTSAMLHAHLQLNCIPYNTSLYVLDVYVHVMVCISPRLGLYFFVGVLTFLERGIKHLCDAHACSFACTCIIVSLFVLCAHACTVMNMICQWASATSFSNKRRVYCTTPV